MSEQLPEVCFISTSNYTFKYFLAGYIDGLADRAPVQLVANAEHGLPEPTENIQFKEFSFRRQPSPIFDLVSLVKLWWFLRKSRFDIVYTISPKGGMLGSIAALFAGVPKRVHFFTGQVWVTRTGIFRKILKSIDRLIGSFCTSALVDSESQRAFLADEGVITHRKTTVLGSGSVAGIDIQRFGRDSETRDEMRRQHNIADDETVLLFLGRLNRDKGVLDLMAAFKILCEQFSNLRLIMVGPDEGMQELLESDARDAGILDKVSFPGLTSTPEKFYQAADLFCLPSYREGFGVVALEAAACGLPGVVSDIYGLRDAVLDGQTGLLHKPRDARDIAAKAAMLIQDETQRAQFSENGFQRVKKDFAAEVMVKLFLEYHDQQFEKTA